MRLSAKTLAAMLTGLALAAFQPDSDAQSRDGSRSSSSSRSSSVSRSSSGQSSRSTSSSSYSRSSSNTRKEAVRPSVSGRPSGTPSSSVNRPENKPKPDIRPSDNKPKPDIRPSDRKPSVGQRPSKPSVDRPSKPSVDRPSKPSGGRPSIDRPHSGGHHAGKPDFRPGPQHKPVHVHKPSPHNPHRVHPRDRDFVHYTKPSYHWSSHNHCYGHRVRALPVHAHRHVYRGVTYYCYDNIWYRPYSGYYVVCRPPFGTILAANLISDMVWSAVRFSYYNSVLQAQNSAPVVYQLPDELGLARSYASAGATYYYQDGVFYTADANGQYSVIIPPAGALVESLPEDFDIVTLNGKEYYRVDDTIYKMTISDGKPYFEVLGQMN